MYSVPWNKQRGFTLLGILFILLVVIAISLYAAVQFQQRAKIQKVQLTAMQMHNILEGLLAYFTVEKKWPSRLSDLYNQSDASKRYIAKNVMCSSWPVAGGGSSCADNLTGSSNTLAGYTLGSCSSPDSSCSVDITLPDSTSARLLKNALDGALLSGNTVFAYVQAPKDSRMNRIVQMGQTMDANQVADSVLMQNGTFCSCAGQNDQGSDGYKCRRGKGGYDNDGKRYIDKCDMANVPVPTDCPSGSFPQIFVAPFGLNGDVTALNDAGPLANYHIWCDAGSNEENKDQNCDCDYRTSKGQTNSSGWRISSKWTSPGTFKLGRTRVEPIAFFVACIEEDKWDGHAKDKGWECKW